MNNKNAIKNLAKVDQFKYLELQCTQEIKKREGGRVNGWKQDSAGLEKLAAEQTNG